MNQHQFNPSPRALAQSKYNIARTNLLMVVAFTVINIILTAIQSDVYFLFSASIPLFLTGFGLGLALESEMMMFLGIFTAFAIVLTVPYLLCWIFSKKHHGWMIAALIYFALDCVLLLGLLLLSFDGSLIIDIAFHAWVMYYLIIGVKYGKELKALPADAPISATMTEGVDANGEPITVPEDTVALRMAGSEEKTKVYVQAQVGANTIIYRKYGKNTEELVVNGHVYAEYVFRGIAQPHVMNAVVNGLQITVGYYQKNYIMVNNEVIAESVRWI